MKKLYEIRKYVYAESAEEAMRIEVEYLPEGVWANEDWQKNHIENPEDISVKRIKK